jgi:hypothetical protein
MIADNRGIRTEDPPRTNVQLVVNSAYWLVGQERYIAAGALKVQPVEAMTNTQITLIWLFCVVLLPLGVLAAGGMVLLMRKR